MATITITTDKNIDECIYPVMVGVATGGTSGASTVLNAQTGTWTTRTLPASAAWNCVCAGDDRFVAVAGGPSTTAGYSLDGVTWVAATLPASKEWKKVIWAGDRFVAIAYGATDSAYSYDGVTWFAGGALPSTANWQTIAYDSTSNTLAVTSSTTAGAYSTDKGATWSSSTLPAGDWRGLTFGEGLFVAVSYGSDDATTSADGITWDATPDTLPATANWSSIAYGNGSFVAVAYGGTNAAYSTDGTTWSGATLSASLNWNNVMYCPSNTGVGATSVSMFFATAYGSNASSYSTNDGANWSADTISTTANWTSYTYIPAVSGDSLVIADGATITVNTTQKRFFKSISINNGVLNVTNTSTSTGIRMPMGRILSGSTLNAINVNGLGTMNVTGDYISLGTGDGTANQTFNAWTTDFIPVVWVETGNGTGVFEQWHNITTYSSSNMINYAYTDNSQMKYAGAGVIGKFFTQGQHSGTPTPGSKFKDQFTNVLTFGDGTNGNVVPNGAIVKIPNIIFAEDTQIQNFNTGYMSLIDMTNSGSLTINKALLSEVFYINCTTAALISWTDLGMSRRPVVTKCANFNLTRVAMCQTPALILFVGGIRTVYDAGIFSASYTWSYLNNAVINDFSYSKTVHPANYMGSSNTQIFQFQYCNNLVCDGITIFQLNTQATVYTFILDFVNYSVFNDLKVYGAGWYVQNCTETTVDNVEYLNSFDNRTHGVGSFPTFMYDKTNTAWADGTDYYFKLSSLMDHNWLMPLQDSKKDCHVKPFTATLESFPYYVGMTPGSNTVSCVYGPASILPYIASPAAFDLFRDTAVIKSANVTLTVASPCVVTWTGHGLADDQPVVFTISGGTLPTGLTAGTTYYVNYIDADTFNLATTPDGANINTSGSQTGTQVCTTGSRVATTATASTTTLTDATAVNDTKYYYVLRKYESAGNVKDVNWSESSSMEVTPRAQLTFNNYCLQSEDMTSATWAKTNISGTGTAAAKQGPIPASTAAADLLVATGNATLTQTISGLTAGNTYTWYIALSTDDSISGFKIKAVSGATTVETAATDLYQYWKLLAVTILIPPATTTCTLTIGSSNTWTSGMRVYATMSNFNGGSVAQDYYTPYLPTTTAAITGRLYHQLTRAQWNRRERTVQFVLDIKTVATSMAVLYDQIHEDSTTGFTPTNANSFYKSIAHRWNSYVNNINCKFQGHRHSTLEKHFHGNSTYSSAVAISNCNTCKFLNFEFENAGRGARKWASILLGSKDCLLSNFVIPESAGYPLDISSTIGANLYVDNSNAGITFQNFFSDFYDAGFRIDAAKDCLIKGFAGANGQFSDLSTPGTYYDSIGRTFTSVFDKNFYEVYQSASNGILALRFNGSEKTTGSAIAISGGCGFDATGKLYIWDTDASITFTIPYELEATTGFRNVEPRYNTTFWTSAVTADLVSSPLGLNVEYQINSGSWTVLNATNLYAETITAPFTFKIRITANRVVEYDNETGGGFAVSDTITGLTSGATATVAAINDLGTYGQLKLTGYTLGPGDAPFVNNEYLQVSGTNRGIVNQGTTYSDNTFPNAGCYIDALDIFTTVDQTKYYTPYTGGTLTLPTTITDGGDYDMIAPATIVFSGTATPDDWNLSDSTFETDTNNKITLTNTSGAAITVALPSGTNVINTGVGAAAITVTAPPVNTGLDFSGIETGSTVKVFATGTQTVLATPTGPTWRWSESYVSDQTVDYTVQKVGFLPIRVTGIVCGNTVQNVAIQQTADRSYLASSGLSFGTTATVDVGAKEFTVTTATTVQNWYSFMIESWITESTLQNVEFPLSTNGPGSFTLGDDWVWGDGATSINFLYNDGMRYVDSSDVVQAIWAGITTLGTPAGMTVKYRQQPAGAISSALTTGPMAQLVQVYSNGVYDYRDHMVLKVQEPGYSQPKPDLVATYGNLEDQFYVTALVPLLEYATTNADIDAAHLALDNTAKTYTITASHTLNYIKEHNGGQTKMHNGMQTFQ